MENYYPNSMVPLVFRKRGGWTECCHRGLFCLVDKEGNVIANKGNSDLSVFMRSCAKPFQALPLIKSKSFPMLQVSSSQLAVIVASHTGEKIHINVLQDLLTKNHMTSKMLTCGLHYPFNKTETETLIKQNKKPTVLHNNCSGKHIGMLLTAKLRGWTVSDYADYSHPVQEMIRQELEDILMWPASKFISAKDGCGVPTYAIPLKKLALAYCKLGLSINKQTELQTIAHAMISHPQLIAGEGLLETELMKRLPDRIILKRGADGVLCAAIPEMELGLAIKIESGDRSACNLVAIEILHQLGIIDESLVNELQTLFTPFIYSWQGEVVGETKTVL